MIMRHYMVRFHTLNPAGDATPLEIVVSLQEGLFSMGSIYEYINYTLGTCERVITDIVEFNSTGFKEPDLLDDFL